MGKFWQSRPGKIALYGLAAGLVIGLGTTVYAVATLPALPAGELNPPISSVVYDMNGKAVGPLSGVEQRDPVRFTQIPKQLQEAFVASEDARFYKHRGVDLVGIGRAAVRDLATLSFKEGGSTITQQVVKNTLLGPRRTPVRKIQEALLALMLERRYSKDEILNLYLNEIYLGSGAYGVGAAAHTYFGHDLSHLTLGEAATLTGLTPGPEAFNPFEHPDLARERRDLVLDRMVTAGYLDPATAAAEKQKPLSVTPNPPQLSRPYAWFTDVVRRELVQRFRLKENEVDTTGLKIYTTLDTKAQSAAEKTLGNDRLFPKNLPAGLEAAMAILDPKSGEVRAVIGGRQPTPGGMNRAVDAQRSPGSALKPVIVYGPALEAGKLTPDTLVPDKPIDLNGWKPQDFDGQWRGNVTVREALRLSLNVPAVQVLSQVGVPQATDFARNLGIALQPSDRSLTIALGGLAQGVSPVQVAAAYQAFANGGTYHEPHLVTRVVVPDGSVLGAKTESHSAMSRQTANTITDMLETVVRSGTGQGALLNRPMAGKTGTAELPDLPEYAGLHGNRDAWFAGYTPDLVGVVWMGYDRTDRQHYLPADVNGSTYPTQLWKQVMSQVLAGRPPVDFNGLQVAMPAIQGLAAQVDPQQGTITLQWQADRPAGPARPLRYYVFRGTTPAVAPDPEKAVATVDGPPAVDTPDQPGLYYYRVAAVDPETGRMGPASAPVQADLAAKLPGLPGIVNLKAAVNPGAGSVTLHWAADPPSDANLRFVVLRGDSPDVPADADHTVTTSDSVTATDTPPAPGVYYYRVIAADPVTGKLGQPSPAVKADLQSGGTTPGSLPEIRNLKAAVDPATGRVRLTWAGAPGVSYRIYRAPAINPNAGVILGSVTSPAGSDQPGPGQFLYAVAAIDPATGSVGPISDPVPVTVPPPTGSSSGATYRP